MLSQLQLKRLKKIRDRFRDIDRAFIREVAERMAEMRDQEALELALLFVLLSQRSAAIDQQLNNAVIQTAPEVTQIVTSALSDTYKDKRWAESLKDKPLPKEAREALDDYARSVSRNTAASMTEAIRGNNVSSAYQKAVNGAFLAARSGLGNFDGLTRPAVRDLATRGIRSNDGWRMENAIRRVILDGVWDIQQRANDIISTALGLDAKEISVHANPAPDHEPIQGRVFLNSEFEKMQRGEPFVDMDGRQYPGMERAIGTLNCRHIAYGFDSKKGKRRYTPEQLDRMIAQNAQGCELGGKRYSLYKAQQHLRQMGNLERVQSDIAVAAEAIGDKVLQADCEMNVRALKMREKIVREEIKMSQIDPKSTGGLTLPTAKAVGSVNEA